VTALVFAPDRGSQVREPSVPLYILTVSDPLLVGPVTVPFAKRKSPVRDRVPSVRRLLPGDLVPVVLNGPVPKTAGQCSSAVAVVLPAIPSDLTWSNASPYLSLVNAGTPPAGSDHLSCSATLSSPAWTHGSSTPGEPETPTPAITSSPSLTGNPPGMAMTLGKVTCWRTTGSLSAKRLA